MGEVGSMCIRRWMICVIIANERDDFRLRGRARLSILGLGQLRSAYFEGKWQHSNFDCISQYTEILTH